MANAGRISEAEAAALKAKLGDRFPDPGPAPPAEAAKVESIAEDLSAKFTSWAEGFKNAIDDMLGPINDVTENLRNVNLGIFNLNAALVDAGKAATDFSAILKATPVAAPIAAPVAAPAPAAAPVPIVAPAPVVVAPVAAPLPPPPPSSASTDIVAAINALGEKFDALAGRITKEESAQDKAAKRQRSLVGGLGFAAFMGAGSGGGGSSGWLGSALSGGGGGMGGLDSFLNPSTIVNVIIGTWGARLFGLLSSALSGIFSYAFLGLGAYELFKDIKDPKGIIANIGYAIADKLNEYITYPQLIAAINKAIADLKKDPVGTITNTVKTVIGDLQVEQPGDSPPIATPTPVTPGAPIKPSTESTSSWLSIPDWLLHLPLTPFAPAKPPSGSLPIIDPKTVHIVAPTLMNYNVPQTPQEAITMASFLVPAVGSKGEDSGTPELSRNIVVPTPAQLVADSKVRLADMQKPVLTPTAVALKNYTGRHGAGSANIMSVSGGNKTSVVTNQHNSHHAHHHTPMNPYDPTVISAISMLKV